MDKLKHELLNNEKIIIISKPGCVNCIKLIAFLKENDLIFKETKVSHFDEDDYTSIIDYLKDKYNLKEYPITFIKNECFTNYLDVIKHYTFS
jgi:glutaredoxin